jgi:hypothetical protein
MRFSFAATASNRVEPKSQPSTEEIVWPINMRRQFIFKESAGEQDMTLAYNNKCRMNTL